ncbi:MAG: flippase-like domain-containing protein [Saprospiraceae bacterium]|nr:flippase-like domain-containing protein [Saprospiraceae bacterium]HRG69482.1 lysylphosphatidylglycerol synthase transmembrane domain-containing protein [Saprospiraceae bacterium]
MSSILKKILQLILFLSLGLGIMYFLYQKNQTSYLAYCESNQIALADCSLLNKLKSDFGTLNYFWICLVFVGFFMTNYSRTKRWQILLNTIGHDAKFRNAYLSINIAYLANLGLPRIGEFVRAVIYAKHEKLGFDKVFGTVVLDRIADMLSFLFLVLLAVILDFSSFENFFLNYAKLPTINFNAYYLLVFLILFSIIYYFRAILKNWNFIKRLLKLLAGIWEGIVSIRNLKNRNLFLLHTVLIWFWFYFMFVFACKAYGPTSELSLIQMLVVYVFGSFGVFIPSPGGMGTYHFMVIIGLGLYGLNQADSFSFANIAFAFGQFFALIVFGFVSLIAISWFNKKPVQNAQS